MKTLTAERERKGWSKAELARRCGMHPSQISVFESGRMIPYPGQIQRLADALGVDVSRLLESDSARPAVEA